MNLLSNSDKGSVDSSGGMWWPPKLGDLSKVIQVINFQSSSLQVCFFLNVHPCFGVALLKSIIYIYIYIVAFWMRRDKQCIMVTLHCVFVSEYLGLCHWQNGAWHVWPNRFAGE